MYTCRDAKELQKRIQQNMLAMKKTIPDIAGGLDDGDAEFTLEQIKNLVSQADGLRAMVIDAQKLNIEHLVLPADDF